MSTSIDETVSDVRKAAAALGPQIRAAADEIEQGRRLPPRIAQAMKECGVFGMAMPQAWGGAGLDPLEQLRVIETLARFDASAGWCARWDRDPRRMVFIIPRPGCRQGTIW